MKIEVGKREVFTFIVGVFLIAGLFFVYAYGSSPAQPAVFGHTLNEIDGITCGTGQAVTRNATAWGCVNVGGGGGSGSSNVWQTVNKRYLTNCVGTYNEYDSYSSGSSGVSSLRTCNQSSFFVSGEDPQFSYPRVHLAMAIPSECIGKREFRFSVRHMRSGWEEYRISESIPYKNYIGEHKKFETLRDVSLAGQSSFLTSEFTISHWQAQVQPYESNLYLAIAGDSWGSSPGGNSADTTTYTISDLTLLACR